jgi:hypothetical protein
LEDGVHEVLEDGVEEVLEDGVEEVLAWEGSQRGVRRDISDTGGGIVSIPEADD